MVWTYNETIDITVSIPIGFTTEVIDTSTTHIILKNSDVETIINNPTVATAPTAKVEGTIEYKDVPVELGVTTIRAYLATKSDLDDGEVLLEFISRDSVKRVDNTTEVIF